MIQVRKIEEYKGFCMDDLLNIFSKGDGESAVLRWKDKDEIRTEKCYYLDNNNTEVNVFYVVRDKTKFQKKFATIDINTISEINHVRLNTINAPQLPFFIKSVPEQTPSVILAIAIKEFNEWMWKWEYDTQSRRGCKFDLAWKWILVAELNDLEPSFVMDAACCTLRQWMDWRNKFQKIIEHCLTIEKFNSSRHVLNYILKKMNKK